MNRCKAFIVMMSSAVWCLKNPHPLKWSGTNFQINSYIISYQAALKPTAGHWNFAWRWRKKSKKGLGPSIHIFWTVGGIELKFWTYVSLMDIRSHAKFQQNLRGWVTWSFWIDMELPSPICVTLFSRSSSFISSDTFFFLVRETSTLYDVV